MYATVERKPVSPVQPLVEHWLSLPTLVGDISCTSLITRLASDLGLLGDNTTIIEINTPREILGYDHFRQGRWIKREREQYYYLFGGDAIPLPNPGLGVYAVQSFLLNMQAQPIYHHPSTSTRASTSHYAGADHIPEGAAYQSYEGFVPQQPRRAYPGGPLPTQGMPEDSNATFVPARHSFAGFEYRDAAMFRQGVHTNMRTMINAQNAHADLLHRQQEWMQQRGEQLDDIQGTVDSNTEELERLFRHLRHR